MTTSLDVISIIMRIYLAIFGNWSITTRISLNLKILIKTLEDHLMVDQKFYLVVIDFFSSIDCKVYFLL